MSKSERDNPTQDELNQLSVKFRAMEENSRRMFREATEFKPGELTPEEEEFVKRNGLNALNYIPQQTLQRQSEAFQDYEERMRKRTEVMSRPKTDPERVHMETEERIQRLRESLKGRFDGFGYGMFLFVIFGLTVAIIGSYGWPMGIFSGLLMFAVLELSYRLYARH
jgi:hypothetical protein